MIKDRFDMLMLTRLRYFGLCLPLVFITSLVSTGFSEEIEYNRDIRPILSDRCFYCHGPDEEDRQADLRLDDETAAKEWVITPGNPLESELIARIVSEDPEHMMPPVDSGKEISDEEIKLLKKWINQGAKYQSYWAYVPPMPAKNIHKKNARLASEIDQLLVKSLANEDLNLAQKADPVTLIRRLYFDLTGLPPSPKEVDEFVSDQTAKHYSQIVDRLLASPHFGERMAMYWLDLVRYADTVGYHGDQDHNISPYRDWVINAFNANMPFDQFTREQIAGDLLPNPGIDQKVATGYNRLLQTSHEGGVQVKEYLAIYAADRVRNLSSVWMGATVGCAQCHNHKYDPYTIKDFYSLAAFFADVDEAQHFELGSNALPTRRPPELAVLSQTQRDRIRTIEATLSSSKQLSEAEIKELNDQKTAIENSARLTMVTVSIEPREMRVLPRGNWLDDSGEIVQPAVPEFLGKLTTNGERATRLDLANWLTEVDTGIGGLTARVQVNRFWYLLFGTGLSGSLDDFGGQGEPPTHPELLDHLAVKFIESGWDMKSIFKEIVLSQAYQQSSQTSKKLLELDPRNQFFARQGRYRLPAEMIRDNALKVSGLLIDDIGGASVKPYQPEGYYRHLNFPKREYESDKDQNQYRRGVYIHWQRQFLHPMLKAFDAPSREECSAQRARSNTPIAALVLMNDPTFIEAARSLAESVLKKNNTSDRERLNHAFRKATSRYPDETETSVLLNLLAQSFIQFQKNSKAVDSVLDIGLSHVTDDVSQAELAAWTMVTRAIMNLDESISRN